MEKRQPGRSTKPLKGREESTRRLAHALTQQINEESRPRSARVQLITGAAAPQLFVVNGSGLYDIPTGTAARIQSLLEEGDEAGIQEALGALGLEMPPVIDERPLENPPVHAISLAVARECRQGCTFCLARQDESIGAAGKMSLETACSAVDFLLDRGSESRVNVAFLGGEPLANRSVLRVATKYAARKAAERGMDVTFSLTTEASLLNPDDANFLAEHGFSVTIDLEGPRENSGRLRRSEGWEERLDRLMVRVGPLLERQEQMRVSARVRVTPRTPDLPQALDRLIGAGFHGVGFSPLLRPPTRRSEGDGERVFHMLQGLISCGLAFERHTARGRRYPFLNIINALRQLHHGRPRSYPCGAGGGYLAVSAAGEVTSCHRFVGDSQRVLGHLSASLDADARQIWLNQRHIHLQEPCVSCWARYLCGGSCHYEALSRGRTACDFIRGWFHYVLQAYGRLQRQASPWLDSVLPELATPEAQRESS